MPRKRKQPSLMTIWSSGTAELILGAITGSHKSFEEGGYQTEDNENNN